LTSDPNNSPQNLPSFASAAAPPEATLANTTEAAGAGIPPIQPADPAWNGWDVLRLAILVLLAMFASILGAVLVAKRFIYPHTSIGEVMLMPIVSIAGEAFGWLIVLAYMYILVTRERRRPDFLNAIHWNFPRKPAIFLFAGVVFSVVLQALAHFLPIPKNLPIDKFFRTSAEAWVLTIFGVTLAPLMEELLFRAFLYPVLKRRLGIIAGVILTAVGFALLHGAQLMFSWGPVLVIFVVGLVLTIVRETRNSVASSLLIHMAYNGTISVLMFIATDGFRHLERLSSQ
jgi:CAAX protease family protein